MAEVHTNYPKDFVDAVKKNYIVEVEKILSRRTINLNASDSCWNITGSWRDSTPLVYASHRGYTYIIKLLLQYNVDVNKVGECYFTPLHWATINGHIGTVRVLLSADADVNKADDDGLTPLHMAARYGRIVIVFLLLGSHRNVCADINKGSIDGWTPLHMAARYGHTDIVSCLLEHGANVTSINKADKTALQIAESKGHSDIVEAINADTENKQKALLPESAEGYYVARILVKGSDLSEAILPVYNSLKCIRFKRVDDQNQDAKLSPNLLNFLKDKSQSVMVITGRPTEKELSMLSYNIGYEWFHLAIQLNMSYYATQKIQKKHSVPDMRILDMLIRWRYTVQNKEEKERIEILNDALHVIRRYDLFLQL